MDVISDYQTVLHADDTVGIESKCVVVGDDDKGLARGRPQVEEEFVELGPVVAVETARWLVGEYHLGVVDERSRHGRPLPLAAR